MPGILLLFQYYIRSNATFFLNCCRGGKAALVNGDCLYMEGERRPDTMSVLSEGSWTGQDTSAKKSLVCEVGGSWPFLHPEWHQRMLRNIIGASSRRSFLCFWVQSDDWWSDGCQYSLWTKLRLIRLNLNLIVKAICSSLRWRSWNKMSKIEFVLVFLNFLKNCEANVIKDAEK